jgi:hypothetical protein
VRKRSNPEAGALLTTQIERRATELRWAQHLHCSSDEAAEIISAFTLDCAMAAEYSSGMETPFPLFIACGSERLLCPCSGALRDPLYFLWRQLRRRYPADWDRAVAERETTWRSELSTLFGGDRFIVPRHGRMLHWPGQRNVTDVDAIVLDKHSGNLVLIQLKWQDPFGRSPRERYSRASNFVRQGNRWIDKVSTWVDGRSSQHVARALGVDGWWHASDMPLLMVIGRYAANFTTPEPYDNRAAWCSWLELLQRAGRDGRQFDFRAFGLELRNRARYTPCEKREWERFVVSEREVGRI